MEYPLDRQQSMVAVALEAIPGGLFGIFGVGHLYAGRVGAGVGIMVSYWLLQMLNVMLMSVFIGYITAPLTHLAFLLFSTTDVLSSKRGR